MLHVYSYQQYKSGPCLVLFTCISCKSRDWYKNIIVRPNNENTARARASGIFFWSEYLLHKTRILLVLPESAGSLFMLFGKYSLF